MYSIWLLLIRPLITIGCIILSMYKVSFQGALWQNGSFMRLSFLTKTVVCPLLTFLYTWLPGTQNIIDACFKLKIKRLIYTSSPSVVFDGVHGISNGDESFTYPAKVMDGLSVLEFLFSCSCLNDISGSDYLFVLQFKQFL